MFTFSKNIRNITYGILIFLLLHPIPSLAQRGCCSQHGSVAGCGSGAGRLICKDGTYSPSCACLLSKAPSISNSSTRKWNRLLLSSDINPQAICSEDTKNIYNSIMINGITRQ